MSIRVLMIGINPRLLKIIEGIDEDLELYIIEEEELYNKNYTKFSSKLIKEVHFGEYQQSVKCVQAASELHKKINFDAVMPGREYSVFAVNEIAKQLGLLRLGDLAASALTNKYKLRTEAYRIGIIQPRFCRITSEQDLYDFYQNKEFILKPSNRQASLGVIRIENAGQIAGAWDEVRSVSEGSLVVADRQLQWGYQAEDFIEGYEISVESFVHNGKAVFHNITRKITRPGRYSVELGHIIPGSLPEKDAQSVIKYKNMLIEGLDVKDGLMHSEWIINEKGPHLVECAGRSPGGLIPKLFGMTYDINIFKAYIHILLGEAVKFPAPSGISCGYYFTPSPGELTCIEGIEELKKLDYVKNIDLQLKAGQKIMPLASNLDRTGYVIIKVSDYKQLEAALRNIDETVKFQVKQ